MVGILIVASATVVGAQNGTLQQLLSKDEDVLMSELKTTSNEELIVKINELSREITPSGDINILIPFVSELFDRKDQFKDTDLLGHIKDESNTIILRETIVDLYLHKNENQTVSNELKDILKDKDIDKRVKTRIVSQGKFAKGDIELLRQLIANNDDLLAFHSLKSLSKVDSTAGFEVAQKLLDEKDTISNDKLSAALQATSDHLKEMNQEIYEYEKLEKNFLEISFQLLESNPDLYIKDSAFFSVTDLQSESAIKRIMTNNFIDRELKVYSIDQHYMILLEMLEDNPEKEDIEFVLSAMEMHPILDFIDPLKEISEKVKDVQLRDRIIQVIEYIDANGLPGNEKWLD